MLAARSIVSVFSVVIMMLGAGWASGQTTSTGSGQAYPSKPIRVLVAGTGGAGDFTARLIAPGFSSLLGQPVTIDNRPGIVTIETAMKAPPDGYTLMVQGPGLWIGPF